MIFTLAFISWSFHNWFYSLILIILFFLETFKILICIVTFVEVVWMCWWFVPRIDHIVFSSQDFWVHHNFFSMFIISRFGTFQVTTNTCNILVLRKSIIKRLKFTRFLHLFICNHCIASYYHSMSKILFCLLLKTIIIMLIIWIISILLSRVW